MKFLVLVLVASLTACEREQRQYQVPPSQASSSAPEGTRHEENAYSVAQGKLLFRWYNCVGCHAMGGGGMGPPHMDEKWRYGSGSQAVFESIVDGRPNGMPAFRNRLTDDQAWQLVAYVRSMSGLLSMDVAPGRSDGLSAVPPENLRDER
jgi:cytochrome c oxidase cbb3-type subunit 3